MGILVGIMMRVRDYLIGKRLIWLVSSINKMQNFDLTLLATTRGRARAVATLPGVYFSFFKPLVLHTSFLGRGRGQKGGKKKD